MELADWNIIQFADLDGRSSFVFSQRWGDQISNSRDSNSNTNDAPYYSGRGLDEISAADSLRTRHAHLLDAFL
jgi:hypothetical protein